MMLMRVAAAAVNHAHACKTDAHGFQQKFIEDETRCVKIQSMQIEVRLDGESAGPKVIQIKTAVWVDRTFDVLSCLFNLHIALAHKFFEGAQRVLFVILSLDLHRRTVVKRHRAPAQRFHITHREGKQLFVWKVVGKEFHGDWFRLVCKRIGREANPALFNPVFEDGEWLVHDLPLIRPSPGASRRVRVESSTHLDPI